MVLEMRNIIKMYGSLKANKDVSLTLGEGEILAIAGENGAGKSTLMKILYGLEKPNSGEIYVNNKLMKFKSPHDAIKNGIGMVQQHFMLFGPFSVAENIVYANEPRLKNVFFDRRKACEIVNELSRQYGIDINPSKIIEDCSIGVQQRVEILKVLYQNAKTIIFDEPSAVLTPQEVNELLETMRKLAMMGKSIILITHKLHEVLAIADRVMILRNGEKISEHDIKDTTIEKMAYEMVGYDIEPRVISEKEPEENVLLLKDLRYVDETRKNVIDGLSIHVDAGEIVGIAGVSGNGQSEMIQCITGLVKPTSGSIKLLGEELVGKNVSEIRNSGCACIPEDRYRHGCAKEMDLCETMIMGSHRKRKISRNGIFKNFYVKKFTKEQLEKYSVRYSSLSQKAGELSGGNLQKAIVAREIAQNTRLLIAAEPTRGIDIGAMEFVHSKLLEKRENGDAVLLISSELSEVVSLSDRLYVIYSGKIVGEFKRSELEYARLGLLMTGGS